MCIIIQSFSGFYLSCFVISRGRHAAGHAALLSLASAFCAFEDSGEPISVYVGSPSSAPRSDRLTEAKPSFADFIACLLAQFQHPMIKSVINPLLCQQLLMTAPLYDFPVLQHHNSIGVANRAQAVGDDEHCPPITSITGPRTIGRKPPLTAFCSTVTSVVIRITRDETRNFL